MTTQVLTTAPAGRPVPVLSWVTVGFFAAFHGIALLAPWCFSWSALGIAIFLHWLFGGIGICLGYHRLLSHRSFQVPKGLEYAIATLGALAIQGSPTFWVGSHRQHHAHAEDNTHDPHSAGKGFWWSHMLWIFYPQPAFFERENYRQLAPDLASQPYYRWLDQYFLLLQLPLAAILYSLGGWSFVVYGIFVRSVLLWHSTWLVNSITHFRGYRNFTSSDGACNLWWVSLLTYGEGWHNNHHTYPHVARSGFHWWEFDPTWWTIAMLQKLGIASKVKQYPANARFLLKQLCL